VSAMDAFRSAMRTAGLIPPDKVVADGQIHRCDVEGRNGSGDGAYVLHLDGFSAGGFQNWQNGGGWQNWSGSDLDDLTPEQRAERRINLDLMRGRIRAENEARQNEAAQRASAIAPVNKYSRRLRMA
jgi:putative DNA primase/helicase